LRWLAVAQDEDPSEDELSRAIDDISSHPDPIARAREITRDAEERAERLQRQQENNPTYWKRLYEGLLQQIEAEKQEKQKTRELYIGALIVSAVFVAIIFVIDKVL
jgi:phytoene/squalene synthetase